MGYLEKRKQLDFLKQKIESYGKLSDEIKKKINYKFRLDWNYYSNSMEGNTLTPDETRSVMIGNITVGGKPIKDILEIKGHDDVISEILKIGKLDGRLSEKRICEIHEGIMYEEDEAKKRNIGKWKTKPNYIINYKGERFDFVSPSDVPERIHSLLNETNASIDAVLRNKKNAPHPLDIALKFHLGFVIVHPFYDGNGRTARILTNLLLISFGYPPFWITTNERNIYNQYIGDIQGYGGSTNLFFDFATGLILRSQQLIQDAIEGKDISGDDDFDKEIEMLKRIQDPPKIKVKKSKQVIQKTLKGIYFPLIKNLNTNLVKLNKLFQKHSWTYFKEPEAPKYGIPIYSSFATMNDTIKYLYSVSKKNEDSYHEFKAAYWLINYNDQNDFSMEVSTKIYFYDTNYNIEIFLGQPYAGGTMMNAFNMVINSFTKKSETMFHTYKDYNLVEKEYDEKVTDEEIIEYTNQISTDILAYIKQKVSKKSNDKTNTIIY